jgi:hypothetical protein
MASVVGIWNGALQKLGAARVSSQTEDSVEARACSTCYESSRDALLRDHPWNFAIRRATIAADASEPDWGRENSFTLPSDWVRNVPNYPEDNEPEPDWQIEGRKILTDEEGPLYLRYVSKVTNPNIMDALFIKALEYTMAIEMCEQLTQSNTKKASLEEGLKAVISKAKRTNAIENVSQSFPESTWLTCR